MYLHKSDISMNREETLAKLNSEIECVQNLLGTQYNEVIGVSRQQKLKSILNKMTNFHKKIKNNTFEISIVGLEKSGKSTFANAFIGNDILPSKDARCTYTATSIRFGSENVAKIEFYSDEQFDEDFHRKLELIGISDTRSWSEWTVNQLEQEIQKNASINSEQNNIVHDIAEILENKNSIQNLLGKSTLSFSGEELETEVREYIENPAIALAVKEIIIHSDKLSAMPNAILYDVPGFDSPTQLHKDQTRTWMKKSDAVILIVNADRPSFNDSLVKFFESVDKDDDGISIGEKLFVFANRADVATTLNENLQRIREELRNYRIMPSDLIQERLIAGSAKARLELNKGNESSSVLQSLREKGINSDGIDVIRNNLEIYNDTVRLSVMQQRIQKLKENVIQLFNEIRNENQVEEDTTGTELQIENIVDELKRTARRKIYDALAECRIEIVRHCNENKPITQKVCENVIKTIDAEKYSITEDEIRRAQYEELSGAGVLERFDASIRDNKFTAMYNEFIDKVVHLAVEEYHESEKKILNAFETGFDLTPSHPFFNEIEESLKEYIAEQCNVLSSEGYYNSLIRRYSRNLFEILISTPFGNNARYRKFDEERRNFYSLSLFGDENEIQVRPDVQPMHYQILFHMNLDADKTNDVLKKAVLRVESVVHEVVSVNSHLYIYLQKFCDKYGENTTVELEKLLIQVPSAETSENEGLPLFAIRKNPTVDALTEMLREAVQEGNSDNEMENLLTEEKYVKFFHNYKKTIDKIPEEFRTDVCILKNILDEHVMNAICIEIPFLDLVKQNIIILQESLEKAEFTSFINKEKSLILEKKYNSIVEEAEKRKRKLAVIKEIDNILCSEK